MFNRHKLSVPGRVLQPDQAFQVFGGFLCLWREDMRCMAGWRLPPFAGRLQRTLPPDKQKTSTHLSQVFRVGERPDSGDNQNVERPPPGIRRRDEFDQIRFTVL